MEEVSQIRHEHGSGDPFRHLFFASPNKTGAKIVKEIMDRFRMKGHR